MDRDNEEQTSSNLPREMSELVNALRPFFRKLRGIKKAMKMLTACDDLTGAGVKALESRLHLYRTNNLVNEAQRLSDTTRLPLPVIFDNLARQRRIDELTIEVLRRVSDKGNRLDHGTGHAPDSNRKDTTDRWYHTLYDEAGKVDDEDVREAFTRILAGEMLAPGSFSVRTLRVVGAISQSTANHFRRAASVCIRLTLDGKHTKDALIPAIGGNLGMNCLENDGLSYEVLLDLTENGLIHPKYNLYYPYVPLELSSAEQEKLPANFNTQFVHQDKTWMLIPKSSQVKLHVCGAMLTSCGNELLKIVDIEPSPDFTAKLTGYFSRAGYEMVPKGDYIYC